MVGEISSLSVIGGVLVVECRRGVACHLEIEVEDDESRKQ
jgi:hypothetical protein